jgi:hypothetical protein
MRDPTRETAIKATPTTIVASFAGMGSAHVGAAFRRPGAKPHPIK